MQIQQIRCRNWTESRGWWKEWEELPQGWLLTRQLQRPHTLRVHIELRRKELMCSRVLSNRLRPPPSRTLPYAHHGRFWSFYFRMQTKWRVSGIGRDGFRMVSQLRTRTALQGSTTFPWLPTHACATSKNSRLGWSLNVTLGCLRLAQRVMVFWTGADRTTTVEQIPHKLRKKQKQARFSKKSSTTQL